MRWITGFLLAFLFLIAPAQAWYEEKVLLASAARTAAVTTSAQVTPDWAKTIVLWYDQESCVGTCTANMNIRVEVYNPSTDDWHRWANIVQIDTSADGLTTVILNEASAGGSYQPSINVIRNVAIPGYWRVNMDYTAGDTVTYSLSLSYY